MTDGTICGGCGRELEHDASLCRHCGWDLRTAVIARPRRSLWAMLAAGGWRLVVYGGLASLAVLGFSRFQHVGTGPDLATTLRWVVLGDDGRAAELVTIHRAHEIGAAVARYTVHELEAPSFDGDWAPRLASYATIHVRGWIPLPFVGADTSMAPASVREMYEVRATDGWGRPYRATARELGRNGGWDADPEVAADLEAGLNATFFRLGRPDFAQGDVLRLRLDSAGRDGVMNSADDIAFITYVPIGVTLSLRSDRADLQRQMEIAYAQGRQYFRLIGTSRTLLEARLLAEHRLDALT